MPATSAYEASQHLSLDDVSAVKSTPISTIAIRIKCSKTDQFHRGVSIYFSRTGAALCPVSALLDYLVQRGTQCGPLFRFSNGQPLTRAKLVAVVQQALTSSGLDVSKYTGHSFRIGAATTALRAGISDAKIKMLGRWESSAYQLYLHTPREELYSISFLRAGGHCHLTLTICLTIYSVVLAYSQQLVM